MDVMIKSTGELELNDSLELLSDFCQLGFFASMRNYSAQFCSMTDNYRTLL